MYRYKCKPDFEEQKNPHKTKTSKATITKKIAIIFINTEYIKLESVFRNYFERKQEVH